MEQNELLVVAQIIEDVRDLLRAEMNQMRQEMNTDLASIVEQVFGDAYEREVMGHYKRFLVAECVRVGVGVGEYAKVVVAVKNADVDRSGDARDVAGQGGGE